MYPLFFRFLPLSPRIYIKERARFSNLSLINPPPTTTLRFYDGFYLFFPVFFFFFFFFLFYSLLTKKSTAQEVRQKSDISERRSSPLQPLLCLQHVQLCHCATCQGLSYTKNEHSLFYQKFDAEYFFILQFFRKKLYFQRKPQKTVLGARLTIF